MAGEENNNPCCVARVWIIVEDQDARVLDSPQSKRFAIKDVNTGQITFSTTSYHGPTPWEKENIVTSDPSDGFDPSSPENFTEPLSDQENALLSWLTSHYSAEIAVNVLASWRWYNNYMLDAASFLYFRNYLSPKEVKKVRGLPAEGKLLLPKGRVDAVAINSIQDEEDGSTVLRVVILDKAKLSEGMVLAPYVTLSVDERLNVFVPLG